MAVESLKLQAWDPSVYYQEIMMRIAIADKDPAKEAKKLRMLRKRRISALLPSLFQQCIPLLRAGASN